VPPLRWPFKVSVTVQLCGYGLVSLDCQLDEDPHAGFNESSKWASSGSCGATWSFLNESERLDQPTNRQIQGTLRVPKAESREPVVCPTVQAACGHERRSCSTIKISQSRRACNTVHIATDVNVPFCFCWISFSTAFRLQLLLLLVS
jgi:hypothetical protein